MDTIRAPVFSPETSRAEAHRQFAACLAAAGIEGGALDARVLLCAAAAIDHAALVRDPGLPIGAAADCLAALAARRLRHEPVSRILGRKEFWGLSFAIGPAVLDPRPDTEILVETVLEALEGRRHEPLHLLDLGTGCGAILGALLRELPMAFGVGVDRSFPACVVARDNLRSQGSLARAGIVQGGWSDALAGPFDVVVANPPYIEAAELANLAAEVRCYDPATALDGGSDGLDAYRAIIPHLPDLLRPNGFAAFEGGSTQGGAIAGLMQDWGLADVRVRPDLAGHDRVISGWNRLERR